MATLISPDPADLKRRLFRKIEFDTNGGCWLWTGSADQRGYGFIGAYGRAMRPHRLSYELDRGPVSDGLILDHLCRVPACCNPAHLEPVTPAENTRRGNAGAHWAAKTHCPQGHPYDAENTRVAGDGSRNCRACRPHYTRIFRERHRRPDTRIPNGAKTHCIRGHAFDEANTRRGPQGRYCRACAAQRERERRKAAAAGRAQG